MGKKENPIREFLTWAVTSWLWDVGKTIFSVIGAYFSSRIPQVSMLTQFFSPWII